MSVCGACSTQNNAALAPLDHVRAFVEGRALPDEVIVTVSDQGVGIPLEEQKQLAGVAVVIVVMQGLGPAGNGRYSLSITLVTVLAAILGGGVGLASVPRLRDGLEAPRRIARAQVVWIVTVVGEECRVPSDAR